MEVLDLAWSQSKEDREIVVDLYKNLHQLVRDNPERYAVSGDTLAKYAELLTKQTGQVIELVKILHKNKKEDDNLSEDELESIQKSIADK